MGKRAQLSMYEKLKLYESFLKGTPKRKLREIGRSLEAEDECLPGSEYTELHYQTVNKVINEFEQLKDLLPTFPHVYSNFLGGDSSEYRKGKHLFQLYSLLQRWVYEIEHAEEGCTQLIQGNLFCDIEIENASLFDDLLHHLGEEVKENYVKWKQISRSGAEWAKLTDWIVSQLKGRLLLVTPCPNCKL